MRFVALLMVMMALLPSAAEAGLTEQAINNVALAPPAGARVPLSLSFKDIDAKTTTLGNVIAGKPTILWPADFTCKEICGPALTIATSTLRQTGLTAGSDYSLVVIGIDPKDGLDDARRFSEGQVDGPGVSVLTGERAATEALLSAIGYRTASDNSNDSIAHPAAFVTLSSDGRVSRALSTLALQPNDLRLALIEAGEGRIGGMSGRISLLCYGFDAVHGIYTRRIARVMQIAGMATVIVLGGAIALMLWRARQRAPA